MKAFVRPVTAKMKTARVRLLEKEELGVIVNGKDLSVYFKEKRFVDKVLLPLSVCGVEKGFSVKVTGGGISGQASAISAAIVKFFSKASEQLKKAFKEAGLKYVYKEKERKKPGLLKARKRKPFNRR